MVHTVLVGIESIFKFSLGPLLLILFCRLTRHLYVLTKISNLCSKIVSYASCSYQVARIIFNALRQGMDKMYEHEVIVQ